MSPWLLRGIGRLLVVLIFGSGAAVLPMASSAAAQERSLLTPDDYGQFESLSFQALSAGGDWLAYGIRRVDEDEELRIVELASDSTRVVPWGRGPVFSPDGRWLAWVAGVSAEEREASDDPVREGAVLLDLQTGEERSWDEVRAFRFDAQGHFLALHGYAPSEPQGKGADLQVLDLGAGTVTSFGNVDGFAWSDVGSLLALAIATGTDDGNGVQLYGAEDGRLRALDTSGSAYRHLRWRTDAADLAVLRSDGPQGADSTGHALLAWRGLDGVTPERLALSSQPEGIADTLRIVGFRGPSWSDDGRHLSFGLRPWDGEGGDDAEEGGVDETDEPDETVEEDAPDEEAELADLQLWHTSDVLVFPQQRSRANADARRTLLAVWTPDEGPAERVRQVGTDLAQGAALTDDWRFAIERDSEPYPWGTMFGRSYHDVWVIDLADGNRMRAMERVRYSWTSPDGRYLLTFDGQDYHTHDLHTGRDANLTAELPTSFANLEYDTPTDLLPPHGTGGWLEGDEEVFLYDRHDVWRVAPDGSGGERLTRGAEEEVIHRLLRTGVEPGPGAFAADEPLYVSLREEPTERRGFARMAAGAGGGVERLLLDDAWPRGLMRADSAEVYLYRSEARDVSPDLYLAGPELAGARRVTNTNPFLRDFAWTRSELLHFESEAAVPLKGVLLYPANHDPSRTYPMIVYTYEQLSGGIHSFQVPSERSYYNYTVWTQEGYFVLLPDIVYRARDPGVSAIEAVRPAVATVVERGLVDPERVGLIGHSWGGYQATYLPTRTDIFAASVAGAPLTDFVSFMGQIHWGGGNPEVTHWETGQGRMEVPYWEDPEAHHRNSPLHAVHEMETPLLMAFGDDDGVVEWWQGTLFYNFARRADRHMVLLVYEGEGHGFSSEPNQIDYHRRILEWFAHYLKGEPAPAWITDGVPYDSLEDEKRRIRGLERGGRVTTDGAGAGGGGG